MDVYEAIEKRCSVRSFEDRAIGDDKLERVLGAARLAPTARNLQNLKLVVVRDEGLRRRLGEGAEQPFVGQAPVVIAVVTLEPERTMYCGIPVGPVDCAIAIDHMTLAAVAEGLGTCWIGHFDQDKCCQALDVPVSAKIVEMLVLGYPSAEAPAKKRKPLDELVCYEKFA